MRLNFKKSFTIKRFLIFFSLSSETSNDFLGDNNALDLGSSFINLINLGISHEFFDGILGIETIATKNLNVPF